MRRALPLLIVFLFAAATAQAQGPDRTDRGAAEEALANVEQLLDGRGVDDKRGLTTAIAELVRRKDDLGTTARRRANRILARPENGTGLGAWTAAPASERVTCTEHFCLHWVTSTADAPPSADSDGDGVPDYVEFMAGAFEESYATEVGTLRWVAPLPDSGRGGSNLLDVYISDIGDEAYGFAVPESQARSAPSYLVLDNDYNATQFPRYGGDYEVPVQATAAHEFNHTLQFVYDNYQDTWMMESTATWAEEKVFDGADDYRSYLGSWAVEPEEPLTSPGDGAEPSSDDLKMYGSAIWNHWLENRYAAQVVRQAWAVSTANSVAGGGFAPGAYDKAIRDTCGPGFAFEFMDFTAAVAEWDAPNSGIREGATFPADVERGTLALDVPAAGLLDHTAFRLYDIEPPSVPTLYLTGGLPPGTAGSIALVGRTPAGTMTKALGVLDDDGEVTVSLDNPAQYAAITAVITNADKSHDGFDGSDWVWTKDDQDYTLRATATTPEEAPAGPLPSFTPCPPSDPDPEPTPTPTPSPTASPTASPTPSPTVTPTPTPTPATSLRLSRSTTRIRSVLRTGRLAVFARSNKSGRLAAASSVDRRTARRLRVGRRTTSTGTGRRTLSAPGRFKVNVRLTRKVRAALKRHRRRSVRIKVAVTFAPGDGTRTVRRTLKVLLRP